MSFLSRYPVWQYPFFETPAKMPRAERGAAFEAMMAARSERIAVLRAAVPGLASAVDALLDPAADPVPALHRLEQWWNGRLARVNLVVDADKSPLLRGLIALVLFRNEAMMRHEAHRRSDWYRSEDPAVAGLRSLIGDLAILFGEALLRRREDFVWAINDDPEDARMDLPQAGRVVVMKAREGEVPPICFDFYWSLLKSYEKLFGLRWKTVAFQGVWNSDFAGWDLVNAVNGWCDPLPPGEVKGAPRPTQNLPKG